MSGIFKGKDLVDLSVEKIKLSEEIQNEFNSIDSSIESINTNIDSINNDIELLDERITTNTDNISVNKENIEYLLSQLGDISREKGYLSQVEINALTNNQQGDYAYNTDTGTIWRYDGSAWVDTGISNPSSGLTPSDSIPLMDSSTGSAGSSVQYSRGDHRHPSDSNKADLTSLNDYVRIDGTSRMTGYLYTNGSVVTGVNKTSLEDGISGVFLGSNGNVGLTSAGNPYLNFYRAGSTTPTGYIANTAQAILSTNSSIIPVNNNAYNLGTTSTRWANVLSVLGNFSGTLTTSTITASGTVQPSNTNTYTLGTTGNRWSTIYGILGNFSGEVTIADNLKTTLNVLTGNKSSVYDGVTGIVVGNNGNMYLQGISPSIYFYVGSATNPSAQLYSPSNNNIVSVASFSPGETNSFALGNTSLRWNSGYFNGMTINPGEAFPTTTNTYRLGRSDVRWSNVFSVDGNYSGSMFVLGGISNSGSLSQGGFILPQTNNTLDIGSATARWRVIYSGTGNFSGAVTCGGVAPVANNTYSLGTSSNIFASVYTANLGSSSVPVTNLYSTNVRANTIHPITSAGSALGTTSAHWNSLWVDNINGNPVSLLITPDPKIAVSASTTIQMPLNTSTNLLSHTVTQAGTFRVKFEGSFLTAAVNQQGGVSAINLIASADIRILVNGTERYKQPFVMLRTGYNDKFDLETVLTLAVGDIVTITGTTTNATMSTYNDRHLIISK